GLWPPPARGRPAGGAARRARLPAPGFAARRLDAEPEAPSKGGATGRPHVSWNNPLSEEANRLMLDYGRQARAGDPPTARLRPEWRERMEDAVWSVFNLPEFVWVP